MNPREDFLAKCALIAADFRQGEADIAPREQVLDAALRKLRAEISPPSRASRQGGEKSLDALVNTIEAELAKGYQAWIAGVEELRQKMHWRGKDGRDQTLIIFVYGAVKAGKSSLGNYIAHGHSDPAEPSRLGVSYFLDAVAQSPDQPDKLDAARAALIETGKLGVDFLEATSTIQGFNLPGLTWIDSPGLHSKTAENGGLAGRYVDAADLVLYVMSGDSPGRQTEMNSLDDLIALGKPVVVAITRADMCEEDVDDDGDLIRRWVMRPDADRRQMEAYVRTTVAERCTARGITPLHPDIVTLSVRCAEEGGGAETGIPALLSQFSGVLDRAADFKRQAPRAALQKLVNQVRTGKDGSGLTQLLTQLKEVRGSCNETRTRLRACREAAQGAIVGTIVWEVERAFGSETDIARLNTRLPEICEQISTRLIAEHLVEPLNRIFIEWDRSVLSLSATAQASPMLQIEDIYETVTVHNKATGRAVGSGLGGLASLALPYVVVLTGPVGIAIGVAAAMAAATAGGMAGAAMAGTTTHKFKVGTNIEKVKTGVITYLQHVTAERVMRACDALDTSLLGAIDLRLTAMDAAFARFETTLTQEVLA